MSGNEDELGGGEDLGSGSRRLESDPQFEDATRQRRRRQQAREAAAADLDEETATDIETGDLTFEDDGSITLKRRAREDELLAQLDPETDTDLTRADFVSTGDGLALSDAAQREEALTDIQPETETTLTADDLQQTDDGFGLSTQARRREAAANIDAELDAFDVTADDLQQTNEGFALTDEARLESAAAGADAFDVADLTLEDGEVEVRDAVRQQRRAQARQDAIEQLDEQTSIDIGGSDITQQNGSFSLTEGARRREAVAELQSETETQIGTGDLTETDDGLTLTESVRREEAVADLQSETETEIGPGDLTKTDDGLTLSIDVRRREAAADIDEDIDAADIDPGDLTRKGTRFELSRRARQEVAAARASEDFGVAVDAGDIITQPASTLGPSQIADQVSQFTGEDVSGEDIIKADGSAVTFEGEGGQRQTIEVPLSSDTRASESVRETAGTVDAIEEIVGGDLSTDRAELPDNLATAARELQSSGAISEAEAREVGQSVKSDLADQLDEQVDADVDFGAEDIALSGGDFELRGTARRELTAANFDDQLDDVDITGRDLIRRGSGFELGFRARERIAAANASDQLGIDVGMGDLDFRPGFALGPEAIAEQTSERLGRDIAAEDILRSDRGSVTFRTDEGRRTVELERNADVDVAESVRQRAGLVDRIEDISGEEVASAGDIEAGDTLTEAATAAALNNELSFDAAQEVTTTVKEGIAADLQSQEDIQTDISAEDIVRGEDGFTLSDEAQREEVLVDFESDEDIQTDLTAEDIVRGEDGFTLSDEAQREEAAADLEDAGFESDLTAGDITLTEDGVQVTEEALTEEALKRTEDVDTGTTAGVLPERFVISDNPNEVDDDLQAIVSQGGRTLFADLSRGDPQGSAPLMGERDASVSIPERQQIAAIAETANETPGVTGADLTFDDGEVELTQAGAEKQTADQIESELAADVDLTGEDVETVRQPTRAAGNVVGGGELPLSTSLGVDTRTVRQLNESGIEKVEQARLQDAAGAIEDQVGFDVGTEDVTRTEQGDFVLSQQGQAELQDLQEGREAASEAIEQSQLNASPADRALAGDAFREGRAAAAEQFAEAESSRLGSARADRQRATTRQAQQALEDTLNETQLRGPGPSPSERFEAQRPDTPDTVRRSEERGAVSRIERATRPGGESDVDIDTDITDDLTRGGVLSERPGSSEGLLPGRVAGVKLSERGFRTTGANIRETKGTFDENPPVTVFGSDVPERVLQGAANFGVELGAGIVESPATVDTGVEVAENVKGEVDEEGVGDVAEQFGAVGTIVAQETVRDFREKPIERGSGAVAGILTATAAGRAASRAARVGRDRVRTAGSTDVTDDVMGADVREFVETGGESGRQFPPARTERGDIPDQSDLVERQKEILEAQADEFTPEEVTKRFNEEGFTEGEVFKKTLDVEPEGPGTADVASRRVTRGAGGIEAPEADTDLAQEFETVGASFGPEISPNFLRVNARDAEFSPVPGLPNLGGKPTGVLARTDVTETDAGDVRALNQELLDAEGDTSLRTLSPDEAAPGEAELLAPPGAEFRDVGGGLGRKTLRRLGIGSDFRIEVGGRRVPLRPVVPDDAPDTPDQPRRFGLDDRGQVTVAGPDIDGDGAAFRGRALDEIARRAEQPVDRPLPQGPELDTSAIGDSVSEVDAPDVTAPGTLGSANLRRFDDVDRGAGVAPPDPSIGVSPTPSATERVRGGMPDAFGVSGDASVGDRAGTGSGPQGGVPSDFDDSLVGPGDVTGTVTPSAPIETTPSAPIETTPSAPIETTPSAPIKTAPSDAIEGAPSADVSESILGRPPTPAGSASTALDEPLFGGVSSTSSPPGTSPPSSSPAPSPPFSPPGSPSPTSPPSSPAPSSPPTSPPTGAPSSPATPAGTTGSPGNRPRRFDFDLDDDDEFADTEVGAVEELFQFNVAKLDVIENIEEDVGIGEAADESLGADEPGDFQ